MFDILIEKLLKLPKSGSIKIIENNKESLDITLSQGEIIINLQEMELYIPKLGGIIETISKAREFAEKLDREKYTIIIKHNGKPVFKIGKNANPKISQMITQSKNVEISSLIELRKLDRRLRQK